MKELMKNELVLSLGAGVLAFVAVTFVLKQMDKSNEGKSNASGAPCDCTRVNEYGQTVTWGQNCPCPANSTTSATLARPSGGSVFASRKR